MEPEEGARFDAQLQNEQHKMMEIGRRVVALQAFPIGNPDAVPKWQYQKKKTHGKADARGLTGAEIAGKELQAREAQKAIAGRAVTPKQDNEQILVINTPPKAIGESPGATSISLAIRTPEASRRASPPLQVQPSLSKEPSTLPASTAPPRLIKEEGRGKRKRGYSEKK